MQFILQKKSLILSVVFFIFSCLVFLFLYRDINNKKEISQSAQEKWQTENARRENAKSLANLIKTIEPEKTLLETHFAQSSDVVPLLDTIEKLAREVGVEAEVMSIDVIENSSSLIVEVQVSGSFGTIYKLITLLENSPYELEFVLADIKQMDTMAGKTPEWTATFQMKVLSFTK